MACTHKLYSGASSAIEAYLVVQTLHNLSGDCLYVPSFSWGSFVVTAVHDTAESEKVMFIQKCQLFVVYPITSILSVIREL